MADEAADDDLLETAGAVPGALVVGVEDVALGVEADAAGRANAAGRRDELALRRDLAGPAAELAVAVERAGQAEGDPDVAVLVEARAEGVFVVVAVDLPAVGDDLEQVGLAVAVGVLDARDVGPLGDVEPAVLLGQAEHLVQAVGEAGEFGLLRVVGVGVVDHPDLAAAGADGDLAVGQASRWRRPRATSPGGSSKRRIL